MNARYEFLDGTVYDTELKRYLTSDECVALVGNDVCEYTPTAMDDWSTING